MSILAGINQRNQEMAQQAQQERAAVEAEAQKPDAEEGIRARRADFGNMIAAGQDTKLQDEEPTPEEQEAFSELEMAVARLINSPRVDELFKIIDSASDPVEGIGQAAHDVVKVIIQGQPEVDGEVLMAVGESAVEQLVEAYEEYKPEVDLTEDQVAEAFSIGMKEYTENTQGAVDADMEEYLQGEAPQQLQRGEV